MPKLIFWMLCHRVIRKRKYIFGSRKALAPHFDNSSNKVEYSPRSLLLEVLGLFGLAKLGRDLGVRRPQPLHVPLHLGRRPIDLLQSLLESLLQRPHPLQVDPFLDYLVEDVALSFISAVFFKPLSYVDYLLEKCNTFACRS